MVFSPISLQDYIILDYVPGTTVSLQSKGEFSLDFWEGYSCISYPRICWNCSTVVWKNGNRTS